MLIRTPPKLKKNLQNSYILQITIGYTNPVSYWK